MVIYRDVQKVVKLRGWIHTPRCLCPKPLYTPNDKGLLDRHDVVLHHPSTDKGCQSKKVKIPKFKWVVNKKMRYQRVNLPIHARYFFLSLWINNFLPPT